MKKTYYFQHDFEAISDPKIQYLIAKFGAEGYGLWWRIVEMLHQDENNRLPLKEYIYFGLENQLSVDCGIVKDFIKSCIDDVQLLQTDGEYFWSDRVLKNVGKMQQLKEKRSQAGKKSAEKRADNEAVATSVEQVLTSVEQNPTKEKKRKEIKRIYIPSVDEVISYFAENGYNRDSAINAFKYYDESDWTDSRGAKVRNWKQKMRAVWFKDEYRINKKPMVSFSIPVN